MSKRRIFSIEEKPSVLREVEENGITVYCFRRWDTLAGFHGVLSGLDSTHSCFQVREFTEPNSESACGEQ